MWVLESNGDFLQGKRMWLKPGKKYLFGRVKKDGVRFAIDHKTVSRKHFVISVDDVKDEHVGQVHARTKVTISDENSKAGTNIDGQLLKGQSQELANDVTSIRPGSCPHELLIKWVPCVLTFNLLRKEIKAGVLSAKQERVKELDVKAVNEYLPGTTTHLIVAKRNTPKGLQALIDARPLVAESFIDALIYATTPTDLEEEENLCPLETDFDAAWPDSELHLPPPGKEPTSRTAEAYRPDVARQKIFENFTFVFLDQSQYDNLLPPLSLGHGKALLLKVIPEETTVEDVVKFMQKAAGQKHFGDTNKSQDRGAVIMVRKNVADDATSHVVTQVSEKLDQRAIDQSDFLDAILANDAFMLRQAASFGSDKDLSNNSSPKAKMADSGENEDQKICGQPHFTSNASVAMTRNLAPISQAVVEETASNTMPASSNGKPDTVQSKAAEAELQKPLKRTRFIPTNKTFKKFDDDFDPDSIAAYDETELVGAEISPSKDQTLSALPMMSSDEDSIKEEDNLRKRRRSSLLSENDDDGMDEFLPGAAAMKKQKLTTRSEAHHGGMSQGHKNAVAGPLTARRTKKEMTELDVREAVRAQRQAEEDAAKKAQDEVEENLADNEGEGPANLAQIHHLELPVRDRTAQSTQNVQSERWDPKWNGRKNFKKFRRARDMSNGNGPEDRTSHTKLIVPVVEMRPSTYGMGDQYWERSPNEKEKRKKEKEQRRRTGARGLQSQTPTRSGRNQGSNVVGDDSDNVDSDAGSDLGVARENQSQTSPQLDRLQNEAAEILDQPVDIEAPRRTRAGDPQSQTQESARRKRPAGTSIRSSNTAKRQKTIPVTTIHGSQSVSDDSDDLKFKWGRHKQGKN